ncbi:hypothetical protein BT102_08640 [Lacticaseibacillus rhamnosus]|nr:hypothetical protein PY80_01905 [Lacticaseibacillus rhamnosus]OFM30018.1 hypothetical protein HMPREF2702_04275 [Lactobacillus sp. HMSC078F07]ONF99537.1 hypothetical protein BT102_08640 [Lacticaseibacillus rhamnosus]
MTVFFLKLRQKALFGQAGKLLVKINLPKRFTNQPFLLVCEFAKSIFFVSQIIWLQLKVFQNCFVLGIKRLST